MIIKIIILKHWNALEVSDKNSKCAWEEVNRIDWFQLPYSSLNWLRIDTNWSKRTDALTLVSSGGNSSQGILRSKSIFQANTN